MQYWILGTAGAIIAIALGIFLNRWDKKRHEQMKENIKNDDKK